MWPSKSPKPEATNGGWVVMGQDVGHRLWTRDGLTPQQRREARRFLGEAAFLPEQPVDGAQIPRDPGDPLGAIVDALECRRNG